MPELPEVETTMRGISPHLLNHQILSVQILNPKLRYPIIPNAFHPLFPNTVVNLQRRAKYIIIQLHSTHHLLIHLGMSGSLRICLPSEPLKKHDHLIFTLSSQKQLRYHDPRRFGLILPLSSTELIEHSLLTHLGPEPLSPAFSPSYLIKKLEYSQRQIKAAIMDQQVIVGVGNIYANEALFQSQISPFRPAHQLTSQDCKTLILNIKKILKKSIQTGGTTLRDFVKPDGTHGYFKQTLQVYDRANQPCHRCQNPILKTTQTQRSTYYCKYCQSK
jgi:formamidopyrimidine-DNA glycosylase